MMYAHSENEFFSPKNIKGSSLDYRPDPDTQLIKTELNIDFIKIYTKIVLL